MENSIYGSVWPEQEAVEEWWNKHRGELKNSVTEERLNQQRLVENLQSENDVLRKALQPFAALSTSEEHFDTQVSSESVTQARQALQYRGSGEPNSQ